jgi:putative CocE/NonD family hydrolase
MVGLQLMPPTYQDPEGRWYDVWLERIEKTDPYLLPWRKHPARDEYWQSKEIDASKIEIPTFLIGGWRDLFPELMVNAYEKIDAPKKLLMGPWLHTLPDLDETATTDYLAEMTRWWDAWLKGSDDGVKSEPPVTIYVQGAGEWRDEDEWPPARTEDRTLHLRADRGLADEAGPAGNAVYDGDPSVGTLAGLWDPMSLGVGNPLDQSADDARSIAFTGDPLAEPLEVTGSPVATLQVSVEEGEDANLVVKLCEVSPAGYSTLITTGWLKATHRESHEEPAPLEHGQVQSYEVRLWATSYRVPAGHRLRVSVSTSDFPRVWPTLTNPRIRLELGGEGWTAIRVPVVSDAPERRREMPAPDPSVNPVPNVLDYVPRWTIERDEAANAASVTMGMSWISTIPSGGGKLVLDQSSKASVPVDRPDGAEVSEETTVDLETPSGAAVRIETRSWHSSRGISAWGRILVDGRPFFERQWRG